MIRNRILVFILFLILLQLPILFIHLEYKNENVNELTSSSENIDEQNQVFSLNTSSSLIEQNEHGGSWLDSFLDDSGINWSETYNVNVSDGSVKLNMYASYNESNLAGLWHFDETSGNTAYDASFNKNDGTISGAKRVPGVSGNALKYNGTNDYVKVPNDSSLNITNELTISAYINLTPGTNYKIYGYRQILSKGAIFEKKYSDYAMGVSSGAALLFECSGSGKYYWKSYGSALTEGVWHHVSVTFNNGTIKYYLDGNYLGKLTIAQTTLTTSNLPLFIGARYLNPIKGPWSGAIDEVMIGTKAFVPENITGNLSSHTINLPANSVWNTLVFNKISIKNTSLNVQILNALDNQPIPGNFSFTDDGEFDISSIDPVKYPSIKLRAYFKGNNIGLSSILNYWGVSWNSKTAWRDTFFEGEKVQQTAGLAAEDGEITLSSSNQTQSNYLKSTIIEIPSGHNYDTFIVNSSTKDRKYLNVTLYDAVTNMTISGFTEIAGTNIDISSIDAVTHPKLWLLAQFGSAGGVMPTLYDWSINWSLNETPSEPPAGDNKFIDIDPDTLNLKSEGRWITCYIEPQNGSDPVNINVSTILLNGTIPAELRPTEIGDYDNDSLPDLMVKFNRSAVQDLASVGENVTLTVEGYYFDNTYFIGSDTIRVINPPDEPHNNGQGKQKR